MRDIGGHVRRRGGHLLPPRLGLVAPGGGMVARTRGDILVTHGSGWTASDSVDGTSFLTVTIDVKAGDYLLIAVANTGASSQDPSSVQNAGAGFVLSLLGSAFTFTATNNSRMSVWGFFAQKAFSGQITITFGATASSVAWAPLVLSDIRAIGTIRQVTAGASGTGTTAAAAALSALENPSNLCIAFVATKDAGTITPGANYTERGESGAAASPVLKIQSETSPGDLTADATLQNSTNWGAVALEAVAA